MDNLNSISLVLLNTSHPGNIGAAARSMKTMAIENLILVQPNKPLSPIAIARSSGAKRILENAKIYDNINDALTDKKYIFGTTARNRYFNQKILSPQDSGKKIIKYSMQDLSSAIIFGNERTGLSNEDVQKCHYLIKIPTTDNFSSLNLASAVQIISYEIYKQYLKTQKNNRKIDKKIIEIADYSKLTKMIEHLQNTLKSLNFYSPQITQKLQRYFLQNPPTDEIINIFRGIFKKIENK
ncbi:MAG: hypothetical protein DRQ51_01995 [Gammaproteobacteria bacterium]|nr:MAG: hypothetical protein DRQ51_01995 [Gammaproteobacteria bacterium]